MASFFVEKDRVCFLPGLRCEGVVKAPLEEVSEGGGEEWRSVFEAF